MRTRRKLIAAVAVFALSIVNVGCWSAREISQLGFIMHMGIDADPGGDGLIVSYRIANPTATGGNQTSGQPGGPSAQPTFPVVIKAASLAESIDTLRRTFPKIPLLSHIQGLFIGEGLAKEGVRDIFEFVERDEEMRRYMNVIVVRGLSAAELFTLAQPHIESPTELATRFSAAVSNQPEVRFGDFVGLLQRAGVDAYAPTASLAPAVAPIPKITSNSLQQTSPTEIKLSGAALFRGDRLVGFLDDNETRTLSILQSAVRQRPMQFQGDAVSGVVRIIRGQSSIRVDWRAESPEYSIDVKLSARTAEIVTSEAINESTLATIEFLVAQSVKQEIEELIARLKAIGADPVGFGRILHMHYPDRWHEIRTQWYDVFSTINVNVSVSVSIQEVGAVTRSIELPPMETME